MHPICQCCSADLDDDRQQFCDACHQARAALVGQVDQLEAALARQRDANTELRLRNTDLRSLIDIAHAAHHRGLDHCPRCEEAAAGTAPRLKEARP